MDNNLSRKVETLGAGKPWVLLLVWTFVVMAALGCSVTIGVQLPRTPEEEIELRQAYEQFLDTWSEADRTLNASLLETVATGEALREGQTVITRTRSAGGTTLGWREYSQMYFKVESCGPDCAGAWCRVLRKSYIADPETGEKHFVGSRPEVHNIIFRKIDGVWKVSDFTISIID